MKRLTRHDIGNFDWQARALGAAMEREPMPEDITRMIESVTLLRPTKAQMAGFLESARYAYRSTHVAR